MRVGDVMTRDVETASLDMNMVEVANRMREFDIGILPVVSENAVVGVITDRDVTLRGIRQGITPEEIVVRDVMSPGVMWCYEDDVLTDAAKTMEDNRLRRLIVLDGRRRLAGLLSLDDLAARMSSDRLLGTVLRNITELGRIV